MDENELLQCCMDNDAVSHKKLYEYFYGKMMALCLRYAKNSEDATDILHEGFAHMFKELSENDAHQFGNIEKWVKQQMLDTAIAHVKHKKHEYLIVGTVKIMSESQLLEDIPIPSDTKFLAKLQPEDWIIALQNMSPAYRVVYNLHVVDEMPLEQIAEKLELNLETAKSNLSRANYEMQKYVSLLSQKYYA